VRDGRVPSYDCRHVRVQRVGRKGRGRIAVVNLQSEQHVNVVVRIIRMRKNLFAF
jgi:hypothetical protein